MDNYESLKRVLDGALNQASNGKGNERHAAGLPFEQQPICTLPKQGHGLGALTYQVAKKAGETNTLLKIKGVDAAIRELRGCINYAAAGILYLESLKKDVDNEKI